MSVTLVRDARFRGHDQGPGHPECPERLDAIDAALDDPSWNERPALVELPARPATREELALVHSLAYIDRLEQTRGQGVVLDPDTRTSPGSVEAALLAVGGTIDLCAGVAAKKVEPGIALVRPPGHHALPDRAMGFCLFNNVAVAARALIAQGLAERVAIYDWDVHHGNGTEATFYEDANVLYLSTHQSPFYPGTGRKQDRGRGKGEGTTLNVPLPAGTGDALILAASKELLLPTVRNFSPDVILISAGYDPFIDDPLGGMAVTEAGFRDLAGIWRDLAEECCGGRFAAVLEGGYDLPGLGACVRGLVQVLAG